MYHASSDSVNTFFDRRQGQRTEKDTSTRKDIHDHAMVGHKNREGHGGGRGGGVCRTHSTLSVAEEVQEQMKQCQVSSCDQ